MANVLSFDKKIMAVSALAEGASIRSVERMIGVHRDTIMRLGVRVGSGCRAMLDHTMVNLDCKALQIDEIWGFIGKKQKNRRKRDRKQYGDVWTFIALDADTKLVPAFAVGKRDTYTANTFLEDLARRLKHKVQVSTDSLAAYPDAIERGFGSTVDYGQIVKTYSSSNLYPDGKYSPPEVVAVQRTTVFGSPDPLKISTSYVERQNLTLRMHCRRLTRLTNAFSKKLENFEAAVGLHFAYYNFVKVHRTLRMTPAMAAGVANHIWTTEELLRESGEQAPIS
ncbi:MAG: IS1 family transposase [Limisphaerales bacterium]